MKFTPFVRVGAAVFAIVLAAFIAACGSSYSGGGGGGNGCGIYGGVCPSPSPASVDCSATGSGNPVTVDLNVGLASCNDKTYGVVLGFSLDNAHSHVVKIPVNSNVVFSSGVGGPHSADLLGTGGFPGSDTNPETASPTNADISSANFSTGTLNQGTTSVNYKANVTGIYYFGCHFHYTSNGMRTVIIVQ